MSGFEYAVKGDWVQIRSTVLPACARSGALPAETRSCDYIMHLNGFLLSDKAVCDDVLIETLSGRNACGELVNLAPGYNNTFGPAVPELIRIAPKARRALAMDSEKNKNSLQPGEYCENGGGND
jgi:hypothetical protein